MGKVFAAVVAASMAMAAAPADAGRLDRIGQAGTLRVCIWPEYFAITYRDPRNGRLEGIDIDLAHELARDLGVRPAFVDSSFAKLVENLEGDVCDIAMHAVGVRPDRAAHVDFSKPYLASGIYAVATRTNAGVRSWDDIDRPGRVVVVHKGTYMEPVMRQTLRHATLMVVDDFKAREQEVESGRADVFMTDLPYGRRMATLHSWARLLAPPTPLAPTPYAYAVAKGDPEWLARVDQFVAVIKRDGRLVRFAEKHGLLPIVVVD